MCFSPSACAPGTYSERLSKTCSYCAVGQFSSSRAQSCTNCSDGTYTNTNGSDTCKTCQSGKRSNAISGSQTCISCPKGTYSQVGQFTRQIILLCLLIIYICSQVLVIKLMFTFSSIFNSREHICAQNVMQASLQIHQIAVTAPRVLQEGMLRLTDWHTVISVQLGDINQRQDRQRA